MLASSHTPKRSRCFEAVQPTFLPLLSVIVVEKIDGYQRRYKVSSNDASTTSRALGVVTAFHFRLLLVEFCLLFFFKLTVVGRQTPLPGPNKQPIIE